MLAREGLHAGLAPDQGRSFSIVLRRRRTRVVRYISTVKDSACCRPTYGADEAEANERTNVLDLNEPTDVRTNATLKSAAIFSELHWVKIRMKLSRIRYAPQELVPQTILLQAGCCCGDSQMKRTH